MKSRTLALLFTVLLIGGFGSSLAQPGKSTGDLWEDTLVLDMPGLPGMATRAQTHQRCSPRNSDAVPMTGKDDCKMSDLKRSASSMSWKMSCSGTPPSRGSGEMVYEGRDRYRGTVTMTSEGQAMTMKLSGRRIGECDFAEAERKTAAVQHQVAAAQQQASDVATMMCQGAVDGMMAQPLRNDVPGACGAKYKTEFCRRLQTSEGFATVAARRAAAGGGDLTEAAALCGVDAEQTRARFCGPAEQQESLDLLASSCVPHGYGKAIIVRECAGRSYSSPAAPRYRSFCTAVAREGLVQPARSPVNAGAAPRETAGTPQQAAVEAGKQLLKGLFGR
jgi:hypothetical protein